MNKKQVVLVTGLIVLFLGVSSQAGHDINGKEWADMHWKGNEAFDQSENSRWNDPNNWYNSVGEYDMVIPGPNEIVNINSTWNANHPMPIIDNNNVGAARADCNSLWLPDWQADVNKPVHLLMVGGELYIHKNFTIGRCGKDPAATPMPKTFVDTGILDLQAGAVIVDHNLSVGGRGNDWSTKTGGTGTINMTGGTITCALLFIPEGNSLSGANGTVNLDGGIIDANTFTIGDVNGFVYVTDGKLIVDGNRISQINGYISSGKINVGAPNYTLQVVYDSGANTTTLSATGCGSGADLYPDCSIDKKDLAILSSKWLAVGSNQADLNTDSIVNFKDFAILASQWFNPLP